MPGRRTVRGLAVTLALGTAGLGLLAGCLPGAEQPAAETAEEPAAPEPAEPVAEIEPDHAAMQQKTATDMKALGGALMSWLTDQVGGTIELSAYDNPNIRWDPYAGEDRQDSVKSYDDIYARLHPSDTFFYIEEVPKLDGWGNPYEFRINGNLLSSDVILVRSAGSDGVFSGDSYEIGPFDPSAHAEDLVWADGYWVRWPDGVAK